MALKMQRNGAMKHLLVRCSYALVALLLAGAMVVFFRTVPQWSILMVTLVFIGMILMFLLGIYTGSGLPRRRHRTPHTPVTLYPAGLSTVSSQHEFLGSRRVS